LPTKRYSKPYSQRKSLQLSLNLINSGLPLVYGAKAKNERSKFTVIKHSIMVGTAVFFFGFTKLGIFNKIFLTMVVSQSLLFVHKSK
jgi:hypothetical protein